MWRVEGEGEREGFLMRLKPFGGPKTRFVDIFCFFFVGHTS